MHGIMRSLLIGAAGFWLVASILGVHFHRSLAEQNELELKVDYAFRHPDTNLVAIGPSWIEMGFDPEAFDTAMNNKGLESHSFNMGIGGLSLIEMRFVIDQLLKKMPCCIKYLIVSPCYECLNIARWPDTARSIAFLDWWKALSFLKYVLLYDVFPDDLVGKPQHIKNIFLSLFRHYTNFGVAETPGGGTQLARQAVSNWDEERPRGFASVHKTMDAAQASDYVRGLPEYRLNRLNRIQALEQRPLPEGIRDLVSNDMFDVLIEQIRFLRSKGIKVLIIIPPNQWEWTFHVALLSKLRTRCRDDVPFVDFGDLEMWPELFLPPNIRYDDAHMNSQGAEIWSKILADQVAKAFKMEEGLREPERLACAWAQK
jgi:hypothetical protein